MCSTNDLAFCDNSSMEVKRMNAVVISEAWALNNTDFIEKYLIQSVY